MSKVLYRKYRSTTLDEVVGQDHITNTLKRALELNVVGHAYLFSGPRGVGKTSVARVFAYAINGFKPDDAAAQLDIIEIDAASNRRIDEIRDLREKIHSAPSSGQYKVYIIDEVHMLTKEAFNALLKTLEEPPAHVIFILATTEAHKLPETIISRTQRFTFKSITVADIVNHLSAIAKKESIHISDAALDQIAKASDGSFRDALSLLDQVRHVRSDTEIDAEDITTLIGAPSDQNVHDVYQAVLAKDINKIIDRLQDLFDQGVEATKIASRLMSTIRDTMIEKGSVTPDILQLLKQLNMLPASPDTKTQLELELVGYAVQAGDSPKTASAKITAPTSKQQPTAAVKAQPEPTAPDTAVAEKPVKGQNSSKAKKSSGTKSNPDIEQCWESLLNELKGTHNTLYGMARMVRPSYHDGEVLLSCKYAFHVKRLSDAKYKTIIVEALTKIMQVAEPVSITLELDANRPTDSESKESKPPATSSTDEIASVSNIFGGAEVLES